jgi:hypothetical protein
MSKEVASFEEDEAATENMAISKEMALKVRALPDSAKVKYEHFSN